MSLEQIPQSPKIISGRVLYDAIMSGIEPELVSSNLPALDDLNGRLTNKERLARQQRHRRALRKYREEYARKMDDLRDEIHRFEQAVHSWVEKDSRQRHEAPYLKDIETRFNEINA